MKFLNLLPEWAQPVFKEAGLELNFEELKMNCGACTFAHGDYRDGNQTKEIFSAALKCCTFFPDLPNFAAGYELRKKPSIFDRLLLDDKVQSEIALPLGLMATDAYKSEYSKTSFGQDENLLCPHFDRLNLNCKIWKSRPSSCVRFVCQSSRGELGQNIWDRTESALHALESNLAYEAALQLGLVNYEIHSKSWNVSAEKKKTFYMAAGTYVESLPTAQKIDLAGEEFMKASSHLQSLVQTAAL